jgi:hypothetical protein
MTTNTIENKTAGRILIGLLILNLVIELVASLSILVNFPFAAENGFGVTYTDDLAVLGIGLGSNLALTTVVFLFSVIWTMRSKIEGVILGIAGAGMLTLFGLLTFIQLGETDGIVIDGLRGGLTIIVGFIVYKKLKKQQSSNR